MKAEREAIRQAVAERQNGHREDKAAVAMLDRDERANQGNPNITAWCPNCDERTVPLRDGTCGFCDTPTAAIEDVQTEPPSEGWPHTDGTVRRQIADADHKTKRAQEGPRARGPILKPPTAEEQEIAEQMGPDESEPNPSRSPLLDHLRDRGPSCATDIAERLGRTTGNVSTRLRQLEKAGYVRRTGRSLPGGRGGPRIEWELADFDKEPTDLSTVLDAPFSTADYRARYFDALLAKVGKDDCPEHIYDRIERLVGLGEAA